MTEQNETCLDLLGLHQALLEPKRRTRGEGSKSKVLRSEILRVLDRFEGSMSSRQIFYQCVSLGAVENTKKECARVGRLLVKMRREGTIDYRRIVDRTRSRHVRPSWDGVADIMDAVADQFRSDAWNDQDVVPIVACEKQALEGIFTESVDEYGVALYTLRGFNSESFEYEWAEEIKTIVRSGREVIVGYFGDWDPSGLDIERNSRTKLEGFGARFEWERVGLLEGDFERHRLVNVPIKKTDTRAKAFLSKFGPKAAELDALRPDVLRDRIQVFIERFIDRDRWIAIEASDEAQRESLSMVAKNWNHALRAVRDRA